MNIWSKIKPWLGLVSVFLVGVLLGAALTATVMQKQFRNMVRNGPPPPQRSAEIIVKKLDRELELTEQQKSEITQILKNGAPQIRQANRDRDKIMRKIFETTREQIRATLTPEQQAKYDEMMKRIAEQHAERKKAEAGQE